MDVRSNVMDMDVQVNMPEENVPWIRWDLTKIILKNEDKYLVNMKCYTKI